MKQALIAASVVALGSGFLLACAERAWPQGGTPGQTRYVALGDSYTIGTSVPASDRWPDQLVSLLGGRVPLEIVSNLAVNGASSGDVIGRQLPRLTQLRPGFVTLLVGVNDIVRGVPIERYGQNVAHILDELLTHLPADRIVVVSTPDYTRTPRGADFGDPQQQRAGIEQANGILELAAGERGIAFVDNSDIADRVTEDGSLVAADGLHPSGAQYAEWAARIAPVVVRLFGA